MKRQNQFIRIGILFCLTIGMLLTTKPARAATLLVCKSSGGISCTYSTITAAVAAAHAGDTIHVGSATYDEYDIAIGKNLTITGTGSGSVTVDAQSMGRVFIIPDGVTASISGMTITNGYLVDGEGGGIFNGGSLTLNDVIVTNNTLVQNDPNIAFINGGGIFSAGTLTMTDSRVIGNSSFSSGAGIYLDNATTTHLTNVLIENNTISGTAGNGAGIYLGSSGANLVLNQVTLNGNSAGYNGGGIHAAQSSTVMITDSTISNNTSLNLGAGLYGEPNSDLIMTNDTVAGNAAPTGAGGGIFTDGAASLTNVTVADNHAYNVGGFDNEGTGTVNLSNTIIAGNTANKIGPDGVGTFNSLDYNLIQNSSDFTFTSQSQTTHNILGVPADLAALANYGGPTQTMALLHGSPAIDAGKDSVCAATPVSGLDQRGITRPQGAHCDIGAYEGTLYPVYLPLVKR